MNRSDEDLCLLLSLLEKAEKILSLINLSDTAISKYNQLKQMTFEKLNISFTPLIKRATTIVLSSSTNSSRFISFLASMITYMMTFKTPQAPSMTTPSPPTSKCSTASWSSMTTRWPRSSQTVGWPWTSPTSRCSRATRCSSTSWCST